VQVNSSSPISTQIFIAGFSAIPCAGTFFNFGFSLVRI
jgi:hypothetical protein